MSVRSINPEELLELMNKQEIEFIDIREKDEFDIIRIENSRLIPMSTFLSRLDEIDWTKPVVLMCRTGGRSWSLAKQLESMGKAAIDLQGGILACYRSGEFPVIVAKPEIVDRYFS